MGRFDLDVTTHQMAVLFCWENRRHDKLTLENLRLATELMDTELRRTLWSLVAMPKLKRQVKNFNSLYAKKQFNYVFTQSYCNNKVINVIKHA